MMLVADSIAFEAGGCMWFQAHALHPAVIDVFRSELADSGRLWMTFYDWQSPPTSDEFRTTLTRANVLAWFGFDMVTRAPMAFFWLEMCGAMARINFALLPGCTGRRMVRIGREVTDAILENGYAMGLRSLMGETPEANRAAVKYALASRLKYVGTIPDGCYMAEAGEFCGRVITCKTLLEG